MPRKNRVWYPGAIYHVMSRGNRKGSIFEKKDDYLYFLALLKDTGKRYGCIVHACCLMTNHFHILVETSDVELWKYMHRLLGTYADEFNHRHSCSGHLFGGRYTASIIEDDSYFLEVSRYIHLNPVKAMMVHSPLDYEYSSYGLFVSDESDIKNSRIKSAMSELVDTSRVLGAFGYNREGYREFVESKFSHAEQERIIMKEMNEDEMWLA